MLAHDYAIALAAHLEEEKDLAQAIARLDAVLRKKGHAKLRSRILRELARMMEKRGEQRAAVFVTDESDLAAFKDEISDAKKELGIPRDAETVIDASLVGGFVVKTGEKQIDRSYKRALINLYRNIITQ